MTLSEEQIQQIEAACSRTFISFYHHLDSGDYDAVIRLWHEDGVWVRGAPMVRSDMVATLKGRPATVVSYHLVSNLLFDVGADNVTFVAYVTTLRGNTGEPPLGTIPLACVRIYRAGGALRKVDEDWLMYHYDPGKPTLEALDPRVPAHLLVRSIS